MESEPLCRRELSERGLLALGPHDRLVVTVAAQNLLRDLTPAPGRKPSASASLVSRASASTASHPNVRDDGQRPLVRDETARNKPVIWVGRK
jgi:hypothetical protein